METEISLFAFEGADGIPLGLHLGGFTIMRGYISSHELPLQSKMSLKLKKEDLVEVMETADDTTEYTVMYHYKGDKKMYKSKNVCSDLLSYLSTIKGDYCFITIPIMLKSSIDITCSHDNKCLNVILGSLAKNMSGPKTINIENKDTDLYINGCKVKSPCSYCNLSKHKINNICIYDCGIASCLNSLDADDPNLEQRLNVLSYRSVSVGREVNLCMI